MYGDVFGVKRNRLFHAAAKLFETLSREPRDQIAIYGKAEGFGKTERLFYLRGGMASADRPQRTVGKTLRVDAVTRYPVIFS